MLARLYVCVRVSPSWYAAASSLEKDVTSNKDSPKIKQNLVTALLFHQLLCRHGPKNIHEGLDVYFLNPVQFSQKISERRQNASELLAHHLHGPEMSTGLNGLQRHADWKKEDWFFCKCFCVKTQAQSEFWRAVSAFTQDGFWTSTRKPCGLSTTNLSVGCGGHPSFNC